jgi:hypothetical protein
MVNVLQYQPKVVKFKQSFKLYCPIFHVYGHGLENN